MPSNFTLQDIFGILLAISLFPFVFVFPGYVTGWVLDLFDFKKRTSITQIVMAMPISASIAPAGLFLIYRFTSSTAAIGILILLAIIGIYIFTKFYKPSSHANEYKKPAVTLALLWIALSILTLVDLHIDGRLYLSTNSYDLTTRVSVVDAITRSGVPPLNPSYYPGHPVLLNFLYYYWYILASVVDQMGGGLVSAYHAMIASVSWAGILLFATLATYLRVRDKQSSQHAWKKSFMAIQFLAVGGLDFIMVLMMMASFNFQLGRLPFQGHVEGWNMPIMSWMNALAWVPHHLTAALACITAMLIAAQDMQKKYTDGIARAVIIGLAFASAFGLSVWVMFVFAIFWFVWGIILFLKEKKYHQLGLMLLGGLFGAILVIPFISGFLHDGGTSSSNSGLPVGLFIRPFTITDLLPISSPLAINILNIIFLPLNYLFELGFFFLIAVIWMQEHYKRDGKFNPIYRAELILVIVSFVTLSFLHSTIIVINDLGIRGWLPMQFILVVWSADVIFHIAGEQKWLSPKLFNRINGTKILRLTLSVTLVIGFLTMGLEILSLRTWSILVDMNVVGFPNDSSPDTHLGERTYSARLAYNFLRDNIPSNVIVQNNPLDFLDRPSGLYGNHQMIISDRTSYGVPLETYHVIAEDVGTIFTERAENWDVIDASCRQYSIDILVIKDLDPLWGDLRTLKKERPPLYENEYYALYSCGNHAATN
jgi:hypothetical protein